jgi:hypothetical protein
MKKELLKKLQELKNRKYYQTGEIWGVLRELEDFAKNYTARRESPPVS